MTSFEDDELNVSANASEAAQELNASDRCDACGAQAYVRVELVAGELFFCSHHAKQNEEKLRPIAIKWHDESDKLLAK